MKKLEQIEMAGDDLPDDIDDTPRPMEGLPDPSFPDANEVNDSNTKYMGVIGAIYSEANLNALQLASQKPS